MLAVLAIALLAASALWYRADVSGRLPAQKFVRDFEIDKRRPEVARTVGYAPSPDWTAEMIADAALRDAYEPVDLLNVTPALRESWINSAGRVDDELRYARGALLDSIAVRPGWPFYQSLLGQTAFAIESRSFSADLIEKSATWTLPLLNAAESAPAAASVWRSLAAGYLQTWPLLSEVHAPTAGRVFERAFSDPNFLREVFRDAASLLGTENAVRYVPDVPVSLSAVFDYFGSVNDVPFAWRVRKRWERAEWNERVRDLAEIEHQVKRRDIEDVRTRCDAWVARHPVWDFDTPEAHAQAARVLELWPGGRRGFWSGDPMAEVARYLLTRNGDAERYAPIVARQIESFLGVPPSTLAEVRLMAGDVSEAERIARSAEDAGSLSWSRYLLALARHYAVAGAARDAAEALGRLPTAANATYEALLIRGLPTPNEPPRTASCAAKAEFAVHGALDQKPITIHLAANGPALVDIGVNRARAATLLVNGERDVTFTLIGWRDQAVSARIICGDRDSCLATAQPR